MLSSFFWKKLLVRCGIARRLSSVKKLLGGGEQFLRYFNERTLATPIEELIDPAWFPDVNAPDAINLALSAPRCELPLGALRGVQDRRSMSAWGLQELRDEIVVRHRRASPSGFEEALITHGATGAFATVIDAFVDAGSRVVLFDPTSPIFVLGLKHRRARIRWVDTWLEDGRIRFDIESFAAAMRGAKLLVLCDPCNPTGGVFAAEDLEQIAWWARKHDVLIYDDESFANFRFEADRPRLESLPHAENRLLVAASVSKTFGLTAARVGWLLSNRHLLRACTVTASMAAPFVSPLCQHLALTALRSGDAAATSIRDEFAGRRRYLYEGLNSIGLRPLWPVGGYFFWVPVDTLGLTGREFARQLISSKRVLVNPGEPFGPSGEDYIRISYATEEGRLREGLQRLTEFMNELGNGAANEMAAAGAAVRAPLPTT